MEHQLLSLKNIYRLLMASDFPLYSESVIGEKERKGVTVLRFWQQILIEEFKNLPCGRMIWRSSGARNRYTSQLCNRSLTPGLYGTYAGELVSRLSKDTVLNQADRFSQFLSGRLYKHDVLLRRAEAFLRLCRADDPCVTPEIGNALTRCLEAPLEAEGGNRPRLFRAGLLLTLLTLFAAAGDAMEMLELLWQDAYSPQSLWEQRKNRRQAETPAHVAVWTRHSGVLQDNPLPETRFFGREEELYNLQEAAVNGQKCLISGIGGAGKTELLRQILHRCVQNRLVDVLVIVPYADSLLESFARAFPDFQSKEPEESFHRILYRIEQSAAEGKRLLLAIDDLRGKPEQDPHLACLRKLPCAVIVTSRRERLEGFETMRLGDASPSSAGLIFRDQYGLPLSARDRDLLRALLEQDLMRHPLTLKLTARAARSRGWTIDELGEKLGEAGLSLSWSEGNRTVQLSQVYHRLYSISQIPAKYRTLAELFALLPAEDYAPDVLFRLFPQAAAGEEDWREGLSRLAAEEWLEESNGGFFMHPLIAQCLRRRSVSEHALHPFLSGLHRLLTPDIVERSSEEKTNTQEDRLLSRVTRALAGAVSGPVSAELLEDACLAVLLTPATTREQTQIASLLADMRARCAQTDDRLLTIYALACAFLQQKDDALFSSLFERQRETLTVPEDLFLQFCCLAGVCLYGTLPETAEQMILEVFRHNASPNLTAQAYYQLAILYKRQGREEEAVASSQRGLAYVREHPECDDTIALHNMSGPCSTLLIFGKMDEAAELLRKIGAHVNENTLPSLQVEYAYLCGTWSLNKGNLEQALEQFEKVRSILLEYYGKQQDYDTACAQIATVYLHLKRYEESIAQYEELIGRARESGDTFLTTKLTNNLSVCYLEMGEPRKALELLDSVIENARGLHIDILLGEILRNSARGHRLLNEAEQELGCLREAVPLLDASYGPQHERSAAARARMEELEAQLA